MVLGKVIRFGLPTSFVYCTIYQQDIWREGDERLVLEQKRIWKDFFSKIDSGYHTVASYFNLTDGNKKLGLANKFEIMNLKGCWNAHVMQYFASASKGINLEKLFASDRK